MTSTALSLIISSIITSIQKEISLLDAIVVVYGNFPSSLFSFPFCSHPPQFFCSPFSHRRLVFPKLCRLHQGRTPCVLFTLLFSSSPTGPALHLRILSPYTCGFLHPLLDQGPRSAMQRRGLYSLEQACLLWAVVDGLIWWCGASSRCSSYGERSRVGVRSSWRSARYFRLLRLRRF